MAILQVYIPNNRDIKDGFDNLKNYGKMLAAGTSVRKAKELIYKTGLSKLDIEQKSKENYIGLESFEPVTTDESLSFGHKGVFGLEARNAIYFSFPKSELVVTLMDVEIEVSLKNTFVNTPMTGLRKTVKEFIAAEDYTVNIQGSLIGYKPNAFPLEDLKELIEIMQYEGEISVGSKYLEIWGIGQLVLSNYQFPQKGNQYTNVQHFNLNFLSDTKDTLIIE